jgi:uncharacterized protein YozE (UPF0346 family)
MFLKADSDFDEIRAYIEEKTQDGKSRAYATEGNN